jgi:hypothetical protein
MSPPLFSRGVSNLRGGNPNDESVIDQLSMKPNEYVREFIDAPFQIVPQIIAEGQLSHKQSQRGAS